MNKELEHIIKLYCTKSHRDLNDYLLSKSKDLLISVLTDLLTIYMNDKNSSTLREFITVSVAGYNHLTEKIGYNGFRQDAFGKTINCEAKPKNINTFEFEKYKNGKRKTLPSKLNGGGNFTDYTPNRFEKDKENNPNILVSGFVDGKLIYILEFPFCNSSFLLNLEKKLERWKNKLKGSQSTTGQFLRSADFDFKDYIYATSGSDKEYSKDVKILYLLPKSELKKFENYIVKEFYNYLYENAQ
ncbi:MAG: hypothetical protein AB1304_05675 [Bacteroidota bacterium]